MRKGLAFVAGLSFVGLCAVAVACGDDSDNVFPGGGGQEDASFDTGPGFIRDGGGVEDSGPVLCPPAKPTQFDPTWNAPTPGNDSCTAEEIAEYYDTCLPDFDKEPCTTWLAAHADCGGCIQKEDNSGAVQVFKEPAIFYRLNQGGCVALVQKKFAENQCGAAFEATAECKRVSCDDCLAKPNADFGNAADCTDEGIPTSYVCCQVRSARTGCKEYEEKQTAACPGGYRNPDGGAPQCGKATATEDDRSLYLRGIGIFCGPGG